MAMGVWEQASLKLSLRTFLAIAKTIKSYIRPPMASSKYTVSHKSSTPNSWR